KVHLGIAKQLRQRVEMRAELGATGRPCTGECLQPSRDVRSVDLAKVALGPEKLHGATEMAFDIHQPATVIVWVLAESALSHLLKVQPCGRTERGLISSHRPTAASPTARELLQALGQEFLGSDGIGCGASSARLPKRLHTSTPRAEVTIGSAPAVFSL